MKCLHCGRDEHQDNEHCKYHPTTEILDSRLPYLDRLLRYAYGTNAGIHVHPEDMLYAFAQLQIDTTISVTEWMSYIKKRLASRTEFDGHDYTNPSQRSLRDAADPEDGFVIVYGYWHSLHTSAAYQRDVAILEILQHELPQRSDDSIPWNWYTTFALIEPTGNDFSLIIEMFYDLYHGNLENITEDNDRCTTCGTILLEECCHHPDSAASYTVKLRSPEEKTVVQCIDILNAGCQNFRQIAEKHEALDREVAYLEERRFLTPDEELREKQMKKDKLRLKDVMKQMIERYQRGELELDT